MSSVYPKGIEQLVAWALTGGGPTDAAARVIGLGAAYAFDSAHNDLSDLTGNTVTPFAVIPGFTYVDGIINGDDVTITGLVPPVTLDSIAVYLNWTLPAPGTLLLAHIDQSLDGSVPQVVSTSSVLISWNAAGIAIL